MIKKIIVSLLVLGSVTTANAENVRIAYSKAENVEIFAKNPSPNGEWCADNIEVNVTSTNPDMDFGGQAFDQLIAKVGAAVIEKSCPSATQMTIYQGANGTLIGAAVKNGQWSIIRDAANEEDPPSGEDTSEPTIASGNTDESNGASSGNVTANNNPSTNTESDGVSIATKTQEPAPVMNEIAASKILIVSPKPDASLIQSQLDEVKKTGLRDMPLTKENESDLSKRLEKISESYQHKIGQNQDEAATKVLKSTIEDMGYSFDLSFRRAFMFGGMRVYNFAGIFFDPYEYISNNSDESLKDGIISKRTYGIIHAMGVIPSKENIEFLGYIQECQNNNAGRCNGSLLLALLKNKGIIKIKIPDENTNDRAILANSIRNAYQFYSTPNQGHWIVTDRGEDFNVGGMFDSRNQWFKLNEEAIQYSLNAMKIREEETEFFNKTGSIQTTPHLKSSGSWMFWLVLLSGVFVLIDAKRIGVRKGLLAGMGNMGPWSWCFGTLLLWIVVFPMYLLYRGKYKAAIKTQQSSATPPASSAVGSIEDVEKLATLRDKGLISSEEFEAKKKQILNL